MCGNTCVQSVHAWRCPKLMPAIFTLSLTYSLGKVSQLNLGFANKSSLTSSRDPLTSWVSWNLCGFWRWDTSSYACVVGTLNAEKSPSPSVLFTMSCSLGVHSICIPCKAFIDPCYHQYPKPFHPNPWKALNLPLLFSFLFEKDIQIQ